MAFPKGSKLDRAVLEKRRLRAAKLLKKGLWPSEVARRVGVHRQSVSRWARALQRDGQKGLERAARAGRPPRLDERQIRRVEQRLRQGPQALGYATGLWTAQRVAHLIEKQTGVRFHHDHIYRFLQNLGWSCQRPVGRALERDERKIADWKKRQWPAIKKKPSVRAGSSSSLTKAG